MRWNSKYPGERIDTQVTDSNPILTGKILSFESPAAGFPSLEDYAGKTILITGGLGFLGSALVGALSSVECRIVLLVRENSPVDIPEDTPAQFSVLRGDIETAEPWEKALQGVDVVFHFAAQTSARLAEKAPMVDLYATVFPMLHMLETCRRLRIKPTTLFAGTVTQVGLPDRLPVDESFQDNPNIVYDIHKLAVEKYLQYFSSADGIPSVTLRLANVYGPGVQVSGKERGVLNLMMRRALSGKTLTIYGEGTPIRDYVYIDDVISAFLTAGLMDPGLMGNYFIIGTGVGTTILDVINQVADRAALFTGVRPPVEHVPPPGGLTSNSSRDFIADSTLFQKSTGWSPQVTLSVGVDRSLRYFFEELHLNSKKDKVT
jgi:nucleoside-diphosphate-sugar epimerase